ncbi:hypothetical protein [Micromonospora sp. DT47]|uniref:hypothetical protein n=1 Tax=Micromonospora sp. DT47 TaxID=3393431 RepID=UPI003CF70A72
MNDMQPNAADEAKTGDPAPPRRVLDRFSDWGPDYGPAIIDDYEEPAYDEPETEGRA